MQIASRVAPKIKVAIDAIAAESRRTASQAIEILLEGHPQIKAEIRKNGSKRK